MPRPVPTGFAYCYNHPNQRSSKGSLESPLEKFTYLFLILIWAGPLILVQWLIGLDVLLKRWKVLLPGILLPTLYLTIVDSFALRANTWTINPTQSLEIFLPFIHVPIEEATFFLVTNTLVVQGLIFMMNAAFINQRLGRLLRWARRGPRTVQAEDGPTKSPRANNR